MDAYIGTKVINAKPMTRLEYNNFRGRQLPKDENGEDEGFLVEYVGGGKANTDSYSGYVSWSPKNVFEQSYQKLLDGISFGHALIFLEQGNRIARKGWNGKGMYLALQTGSTIAAEQARGGIAKYLADDGEKEIIINSHIDMKAADGTVVIGWLASQTDMLAKDWIVLL